MKKGMHKAISLLVGGMAGVAAGGAAIGKVLKKESKEKDELFRKVLSYYFIYDQWLSVRQGGKSLVNYFEQNGYKTVAIYGLKELGERLYDELKNSDIEVKYIIDKNADALYTDVDIVTPDEELECVDVIVVTATFYYDEIEEMLYHKTDCPIVSLEDVISEIFTVE